MVANQLFTEFSKNTVFRSVDAFRKLVDLQQEAVLDGLQGVFIRLFGHESDRQAFGPEAARSSDLK